MKAKSLENWFGCLIKGKEYKVIAKHDYYVLIEEENGRLAWNYEGIFEITGEVPLEIFPFKINWEVI